MKGIAVQVITMVLVVSLMELVAVSKDIQRVPSNRQGKWNDLKMSLKGIR
jgi:hypothetical protein